MATVTDAGKVVEQREVGDLVAQPVDRNQQEAEIPGHRQEDQEQDHHRLNRIEADDRYITTDAEQRADRTCGIDPQNQHAAEYRKTSAGIAAAVAPRPYQLQD